MNFQEGIRFAYIARGSLEETHNHLTYANKMRYLSNIDYEKLETDIEEIKRLINGFIYYLKKSKRGLNEPGAHHFLDSEPIQVMQSDSSSKLPITDY